MRFRSTRLLLACVTDERKRTKSDFCRPLSRWRLFVRKGQPIHPKRRFAALFSASGDVALHRAPNSDSYRNVDFRERDEDPDASPR